MSAPAIAMSAPIIAKPGSAQRTEEVQNSKQQEIAILAYALWQYRGAPIDVSPEEDWIEAERLLQAEQTKTSTRR